jgi:hypothetical protein
VRRALSRRGYTLAKNRRRDPLAIGFGTYRIINPRTRKIVASDLDLDTVEQRAREPLEE